LLDRPEDHPSTAIYVDPPYVASTRSGFGAHGNGSKYKCEFNHDQASGPDDHERLATILRAYQHARIVVSYYDCERVRELYEGWTFVAHTMNKQLHAQNKRGARKKEAFEVLIVNGPSLARPAGQRDLFAAE